MSSFQKLSLWYAAAVMLTIGMHTALTACGVDPACASFAIAMVNFLVIKCGISAVISAFGFRLPNANVFTDAFLVAAFGELILFAVPDFGVGISLFLCMALGIEVVLIATDAAKHGMRRMWTLVLICLEIAAIIIAMSACLSPSALIKLAVDSSLVINAIGYLGRNRALAPQSC